MRRPNGIDLMLVHLIAAPFQQPGVGFAQPDLTGPWQGDTSYDYRFLNSLQIDQVGNMVHACFSAAFGCADGTLTDDGHLTLMGPSVSVDADLIGPDLLDGLAEVPVGAVRSHVGPLLLRPAPLHRRQPHRRRRLRCARPDRTLLHVCGIRL